MQCDHRLVTGVRSAGPADGLEAVFWYDWHPQLGQHSMMGELSVLQTAY
jgi:hypothetical protein